MPPTPTPVRSAALVGGPSVRWSAWWVVVVALGAAGGGVLGGVEHTHPAVPYWTAAGACVALALAVPVGHLRIHPWWGPLAAWCGFVIGLLPPLSLQDSLWLVAAVPLSLLAAAWAALVNAAVLLVVRWRHRARGLGRVDV